ncbi:MAG TPA: indolepyruvate ferredoxin oxidoreductase subunit alpha [Burkholderiaceae bacterium]|mgnify:FL=1|nr:indolepyruvate ferredoxin oxidoreductase subunit alpha [Burkholderiaceae bacterium]
MERSFAAEIEALKLGEGRLFHGEGILAVTKALLQSGVSYVGGYQGAPVSHLLDVMVQARDYLDELGVHVEACTNEASAAAMLGASINYPARGAVTWKSIVGTNVAADALSNLASPGVVGGAMIIIGEDYGEGASVIQERSHAYAMKSSMWLLDPRPNLPTIVRMVERGFELSEASNTPVMMELRIRACHVRGSFVCRDNRAPAVSTRTPVQAGAPFEYGRLAHPPATFAHEKLKAGVRAPAARAFIVEHRLNERFDGGAEGLNDVGIVVQGGLYNNLVRALQQTGLADPRGVPRLPVLCLNVVYPLVPEQLADFFAGKRAVLVLEEGQPEYIEQELFAIVGRGGLPVRVHGKDMLPMAGEYTTETIAAGLAAFLRAHRPDSAAPALADAQAAALADVRRQVAARLGAPVPPRPPTFCVGCPERPVFAALKQVREEVGPMHVSADIGCHAFATFEPFSMGNSILGYGMSLASAAGVTPLSARRPIAIMGDGGFWHNGLLSGVTSNLLNQGDGVLVVMKNGYTSATGTQELISSPLEDLKRLAGAGSATHTEATIENTLKGLGVRWLRTVHTYGVATMKKALTEALTTDAPGLKVIVAEGECQLERQRRIRPMNAAKLARGERVVRVRYGIDEDVCSGDHSCIRLSGCPSLTVKDPSDPLKTDPVATVNQNCVGCGLCGENAHAATLCPSFYRAEIVQNAGVGDRLAARWRRWVAGLLGGRARGGAATGGSAAAHHNGARP